jgi:hypothetical protein
MRERGACSAEEMLAAILLGIICNPDTQVEPTAIQTQVCFARTVIRLSTFIFGSLLNTCIIRELFSIIDGTFSQEKESLTLKNLLKYWDRRKFIFSYHFAY